MNASIKAYGKATRQGWFKDKKCHLAYLQGFIQAKEGRGKPVLDWHLEYKLASQDKELE